MQQKPTLIMLVGLPGSGKSTWRNDFLARPVRNPNDWVVISRDDAVDEYIAANAKADGTRLRYDEVMADAALRDQLATAQEAKLELAITAGRNIIIDRTNLTRKDRAGILSQPAVSENRYYTQAVVFDVPFEVILERATHRGAGKHIPESVLSAMQERFEPVDNSEGFDSFVTIQQGVGPDGASARAGAAALVAHPAPTLHEPKKP